MHSTRSRWLWIGLAAALVAGCGGSGGGPGPGTDTGPDGSVTDPGVDPGPPDPGPGGDDAAPRPDDGVVAPDDLAPADDLGPDEAPDATDAPDLPDVADPGPDLPDAVDPGTPDPGDDTDVPPADLPSEGCTGGDCDACADPMCEPCPDDGLACTEERRDPETGACVSTLLPDSCLVGGVCYFTLEPSPDNGCLFCDPGVDPSAFSPHAGLPCDDGDPCSVADTCDAAGACTPGEANPCDDGTPCTVDKCVAGTGCVHNPIASVCDDGSKCTYSDHCDNGRCVGTKINCNDGNLCTDDLCLPATGCQHLPNPSPCDDLDACTSDDRCTEGTCKGVAINCDDGNPCTKDSCGAGTGCRHDPLYGKCDDGNACTTEDYCDASHACVGYDRVCDDKNACTEDICDPAVGCLFLAREGGCDDGDPCTDGDTCVEGVCKGTPKDCEDGNLCTKDACDATYGCQHVSIGEGQPCDDKNACTASERCLSGICRDGVDVDCDDHNDCTVDSCNAASGCAHVAHAIPCNDNDPCTVGDWCVDGVCTGAPKDCSDGLPCTKDGCLAGSCTHQAIAEGDPCVHPSRCIVDTTCQSGACLGRTDTCDDANDCTLDACDPATGCYHVAKTSGTCSDGTACTAGDHCVAGQCVGTAVSCDDGDPCTDDPCDPVQGCQHPFNTAPCEDGILCTGPDLCAVGTCAGPWKFPEVVGKAAKLSLGLSGKTGQGVDVDANPNTCTPKGNCSPGIDNTFSKIAWLFNPELTRAVGDGSLALVLEAENPDPYGAPFTIKTYYGRRVDPVSCDPAGPGCNYGLFTDSTDGQCNAVTFFDNAKVDAGHLTAGGKAYEAPFDLVFGDAHVALTMKWAALDATVSFENGVIVAGSGVIGGAVHRMHLIEAITAIPDEKFVAPYTKAVILQYLNKVLVPDYDTDDDGMKDSVSVGQPFTWTTGKVMGTL